MAVSGNLTCNWRGNERLLGNALTCVFNDTSAERGAIELPVIEPLVLTTDSTKDEDFPCTLTVTFPKTVAFERVKLACDSRSCEVFLDANYLGTVRGNKQTVGFLSELSIVGEPKLAPCKSITFKLVSLGKQNTTSLRGIAILYTLAPDVGPGTMMSGSVDLGAMKEMMTGMTLDPSAQSMLANMESSAAAGGANPLAISAALEAVLRNSKGSAAELGPATALLSMGRLLMENFQATPALQPVAASIVEQEAERRRNLPPPAAEPVATPADIPASLGVSGLTVAQEAYLRVVLGSVEERFARRLVDMENRLMAEMRASEARIVEAIRAMGKP